MSESSLCLTRRMSHEALRLWSSKWSGVKYRSAGAAAIPTADWAPASKAIDQAWSEKGVAILVDLGGAETNSEMAIEMLPEERRSRVVVCNAPVVEGAVMAATEAASGATLEAVRRTAEELTSA
jgi:dihydroxyacetone kinase DhaKLM complex PTS-EIIA-like component DhaM